MRARTNRELACLLARGEAAAAAELLRRAGYVGQGGPPPVAALLHRWGATRGHLNLDEAEDSVSAATVRLLDASGFRPGPGATDSEVLDDFRAYAWTTLVRECQRRRAREQRRGALLVLHHELRLHRAAGFATASADTPRDPVRRLREARALLEPTRRGAVVSRADRRAALRALEIGGEPIPAPDAGLEEAEGRAPMVQTILDELRGRDAELLRALAEGRPAALSFPSPAARRQARRRARQRFRASARRRGLGPRG